MASFFHHSIGAKLLERPNAFCLQLSGLRTSKTRSPGLSEHSLMFDHPVTSQAPPNAALQHFVIQEATRSALPSEQLGAGPGCVPPSPGFVGSLVHAPLTV